MAHVCADWILTPYRAAIHTPTATAVVADLHLGYSRTRQGGGDAVPCGGLQETMADLTLLFQQFAPRRLIIAGDLLEHGRVCALADEFLRWLAHVDVELVA